MARILVVGSSTTDMTVRLPRLPGPGQTVLGGALFSGHGGKGANQAVAAARARGDVVFITAVGDDALGRQALDACRREGIDVAHVRALPGLCSGVALIFVGHDGENMIGVAPGANSALHADDVAGLPDHLFAPDRLLLVGGLEVPLDVIEAALRRASSASMTTLLNPAPFHPDLVDSAALGMVDVLTPNRIELGQLAGINTETIDGVLLACEAIQHGAPRLNIVVTLGSRGCLVRTREGLVSKIPPHPVLAVDAVGAGDAFSGALAVALAEGRPLAEAATWANAAAALSVTIQGAQASAPTREAIDQWAR